MTKKKLTLNKERITTLTTEQSLAIQGGKGSAGSSNHNFTCCWCTGGNNTITDDGLSDPNSPSINCL